MTETWKPSEGLKRAEAVAAQIKDELAAAGVTIEPMYQWRMTQVIGRAIDEAMGPLVPTWVKVDAMAKDVGASYQAPPMTTVAAGLTKDGLGIWRSNADGQFEKVANGLTDMASEISDDMQEETPPAGALHAAEEPPKKRRGRPPGPGKKKDKKAAKKAAAPDVTAAAA